MFKLLFTNEYSLDNKGIKEKYITKLENIIIKYNSFLLQGITFVDDDTYNNCIELLTLLNPNSPILKNDKPIMFIKEFNEKVVYDINSMLTEGENLKFYLNPVGLNVKLVYEDGELTSAVTVGRSIKNRDIIDLMTTILTNRNDALSDLGYVEVVGTLVIPYGNLNMIEDFCQIKTPYNALFSFLYYNSQTNEVENLEDIMYFLATDVVIDGISFDTMQHKYEYLEGFGFEIPEFFEKERSYNLVLDLEAAMDDAEYKKCDYPYQTDGLRLLVNSDDIVLLKQGSWGIKTYSGIVKDIEWIDEKGKKVPKLIFEESINIGDECEISEFVLRSMNLLLILNISIGSIVNFAYFGDMGVLPVTNNNEIIIN